MKPRLEDLTLREKIGQTACFNHNVRFKEIEDLPGYFKENPIGVLWSTSANKDSYYRVEAARGNPELEGNLEDMFVNFINTVNSCMRIPIMPVMDASIGITQNIFPGHHKLPSSSSLGAANDPELTYRYSRLLGEDMHSFGFRWLWRPVADNSGKFGDSRRLSTDFEINKVHLEAMVNGLQDAGIAACAKHFPGADPYEYRDSHFCTSSYAQSYEYWESTQMREFQACIDAGVASVMIGHKTFKAVDDTRVNGNLLPCTLSYKVITELLKEKMGFKGVVITDDISMKALTAIYPYEKMYVELLRAGNDVLLGVKHMNYIDIIEAAVLSGELPESRIDDACQRVLDMKERFGLFEQGELPYLTDAQRESLDARIGEVARDIAAKGLTLTANKTNFLPLKAEKIQKVKLVYIGYSDPLYKNLQKYAVDEFARHGAVCEVQRGFAAKDNETLDQYDLIVYATYIGMHAPAGGKFFFGDECKMMRQIMTVGTEKSVGVSFGDPDIFFNYFTAANTFVNCYSTNEETIEGFVKGLYGELEFKGGIPFLLNPIKRNNEVYV